MKDILLLINSVFTFGFCLYWSYKYFPFYIEFKKTFWSKRLFAIELWCITSGRRGVGYSATRILNIPIRDKQKQEVKDKEYFNKKTDNEYRN